MAHPLRSTAGTSTWRAGRRSLTFCQSCQGSAQKFGGRAPSCRTAHFRAPPAQEEWGSPEGAKPPWRLFGDFLSVQKVTGDGGEEPRAFVGDGIYSEETKRGPGQSPGPQRTFYFKLSATATATATVAPTMGLLPMPRKPIISTWAGTELDPANCASECIRPIVSVMP